MATIQVCTLANVLLAVLRITTCSAFLLNNDDRLCFPPDQICRCFDYPPDGDYLDIECIAQNLTQFPNFSKLSDQSIDHYTYFEISLTDNELTTIPAGVFWMFNPVNKNGNHIFFDFERNKISIIEKGAFVGINNMEVMINLTDNRITALPLAFKFLNNLTLLEIGRNPILAFDSETVNSMAKILDYLGIDFEALVLGNKELSVLNITEMAIHDIPSNYGNLPFDPFLFFRNTMSNLLIAGTDLTTLPCSLIDEPKMKYFYIQDAININAHSIFDCQPGASLKAFELTIMYSGLEEFPDILHLMPSLRALNLFHNDISSINEKFIPLHNKLEVLNLSYNRLRTISAVFRRFDHLKFLYIQHNEITNVAPDSFVLSIVSLCVEGNPWRNNNINCYDTYDKPFNLIDNTTLIV